MNILYICSILNFEINLFSRKSSGPGSGFVKEGQVTDQHYVNLDQQHYCPVCLKKDTNRCLRNKSERNLLAQNIYIKNPLSHLPSLEKRDSTVMIFFSIFSGCVFSIFLPRGNRRNQC
jgi:hypothetical protein